MFKRKYLNVLLGLAVAAGLAVIPLTAGGQDGRSSTAKPGPAVAVPDGGGVDDDGTWDGDGPAPRDQQILDDLIVDGSICVGLDCVNGESFGFDTLRLKENNLRIKFDDTSSTASFPDNDWQITANDSSNGGQEKFSIDDISNSRTPFTIEASAPSHSLYVDDGGRIGLGTSTPVVELHVVDGDTPTLRLEQDGSSGFTPQTWDVAGNETNFFVRDTTNGSKLPLRIRPQAPSNSIFVDTNGSVGMQTSSPAAALHVNATSTSDILGLKVSENVSGNTNLPTILLENTNITDANWRWQVRDNTVFALQNVTTAGAVGDHETLFQPNGDVRIEGSLLAEAGDGALNNVSCCGGPGGNEKFPDYVFDTGYSLMTLSELRAYITANGSLPGVMTADDVAAVGAINMTMLQLQLLEKVEELTLYTLQQHDEIESLRARLAQLEGAR